MRKFAQEKNELTRCSVNSMKDAVMEYDSTETFPGYNTE
jgi:hypothetical protein